jgi:hypothetical protein
VAQNEDVLGRETEARKLFIVELSEPCPYALLAWVVVSPNSLRTRLDLAFSGLAGRGHASARENWMVIDSLLISLQRGPRPHAGSRISRTQARLDAS